MEITWLGHSCFKIKSGETVLITDPFSDSLGLTIGKQTANIITISRSHPNHDNASVIEGSPRVITRPGEYEVSKFYIMGMATRFSDDATDKSVNTVFVIEAEGLKLCHLGDLNRMLLSQQVQHLGQIDILFVPAGGLDSLSPAKAAEVVVQLGPMIVIPMHYQLGGLPEGFAPVDGFLSALGTSVPNRESRLSINAASVPREQRVVLLDRVFSGMQSKLI